MTQEVKKTPAPTLAGILKPNLSTLLELATSLDSLGKALDVEPVQNSGVATRLPQNLPEHIHVVSNCVVALKGYGQPQDNDAFLAIQVIYCYKAVVAAIDYKEAKAGFRKKRSANFRMEHALVNTLKAMALILNPALDMAVQDLADLQESIGLYEE